VECDPSIKAIINRINDQHNADFIIEDIDDEHILIKTAKHEELKILLKEVRKSHPRARLRTLLTTYRRSKTPSKKLKRAQSPNNERFPFTAKIARRSFTECGRSLA
jgi:TFIIH basal transcription factor complex TTD-A subunit